MLLGFKVYQQNLKALVIPIEEITAIYNNKNSCNFFLSIQKVINISDKTTLLYICKYLLQTSHLGNFIQSCSDIG